MDTELLIAGGGLVGNTLAIAAAKAGLRVTVIEPLARDVQVNTAFDGRTSAISSGSVRILSRLGIWETIAPHAQPIHDIRVCDQDKPGYVHYSDKDVGEPFGYIVENQTLRSGIFHRLEATPGITICTDSVTAFSRPHAQAITAHLAGGARYTAALMVAADGRFSSLREAAGIRHRILSYGQTAMVCVVAHTHPHHGLALEKFYPVGPFAVLPLKDDADGRHRSGIVWTESDADAPHYLALAQNAWNREIERRLGDVNTGYWGEVQTLGKRFSYPLRLVHARDFVGERFALIGDAAHGIHPIAGQGVNLGYRDVAVLAELLEKQRHLGLDIGGADMLAHYQRWRAFDSFSMTASTDLLNRLFSNRLPGVSLLRRAGLVAVDHLPPVKQFFMRHAMGMVGDLPAMMRG